MRKTIGKIFLVAFIIVMIGACSSSPSTYQYSVSATAERTENVRYNITDQQAYSIAKAWVMAIGNATLRSDDSAGGALSAIGSNNYWNWSCNIFVANGIAKITWSNTYKDNIWETSRGSAENYASSRASAEAERQINSFVRAYN
jgi:hypothetical protein